MPLLAPLILAVAAAVQAAPAGIPAWDRLPDSWNGTVWSIPRAPGQTGLWIGTLRLCRDSIAAAAPGKGLGGEPVLRLAFARSAWEEVARETGRYYERPMPIRIDGRAVAAPTVETPIEQGEMEMHLATDRDARRIAALAKKPCPPAGRAS